MMNFNTPQVKDILTTELGYSPLDAESFLRNFPPIHDELVEAVNQWLKDRTVLPVSVFGLSISELMQIQRWHFLMAVEYLNPMYDDSVPQEKREWAAAHLKKPFPIR